MGHDSHIYWMVCYDICHPNRLARVNRYLKKEGIPIQYSLFMLYTTGVGIRKVFAELAAIIDPSKDDVRAYPVPRQPWMITMGTELVPKDLWVVDAGFKQGSPVTKG